MLGRRARQRNCWKGTDSTRPSGGKHRQRIRATRDRPVRSKKILFYFILIFNFLNPAIFNVILILIFRTIYFIINMWEIVSKTISIKTSLSNPCGSTTQTKLLLLIVKVLQSVSTTTRNISTLEIPRRCPKQHFSKYNLYLSIHLFFVCSLDSGWNNKYI